MAQLSKANIITGNIVQPADVTQLVDALTASGSYNLLISGSLGIGIKTTSPASLYVSGSISGSGNITVGGNVTAATITGTNVYGIINASQDLHLTRTDTAYAYILRPNVTGFKNLQFAVEGGGLLDNLYVNSSFSTFTGTIYGPTLWLTGAVTASNIGTVSSLNLNGQVGTLLNGNGGWTAINTNIFTTTGSFNTFTSSYYVASASFDSRINNLPAPNYSFITTGSTYCFVSGSSVIVSGSNPSTTQFIVTGSQSTTGTITSAGFIQSSLRSLKDNIVPFTGSALDLIKTVEVVAYTYKSDPGTQKVGFIADDTNEVFSTKNHNVMDTGNTVGIMLKAIQELQSQIEELKK